MSAAPAPASSAVPGAALRALTAALSCADVGLLAGRTKWWLNDTFVDGAAFAEDPLGLFITRVMVRPYIVNRASPRPPRHGLATPPHNTRNNLSTGAELRSYLGRHNLNSD